MTHEEYVERFDEYVRLIDQAYEAGDHDEEMMRKAAIEMCLKHGPDAMARLNAGCCQSLIKSQICFPAKGACWRCGSTKDTTRTL
jgi:hypothetical protein